MKSVIALLIASTKATSLIQKSEPMTLAQFSVTADGAENVSVADDLATLISYIGADGTTWASQAEAEKKDVYKFLDRIDGRAIAADVTAA